MYGWLVGMDWLAKVYRWKRGGEETSDIETVIIWLVLIYLGEYGVNDNTHHDVESERHCCL